MSHTATSSPVVFEAFCLSKPYSGIAQYTFNLLTSLASLGIDVVAVLQESDHDIHHTRRLITAGVKIVRAPRVKRQVYLVMDRLLFPTPFETLSGAASSIIFPNNRSFPTRSPSLTTIHDLSPLTHPDLVDPSWGPRAASRMVHAAKESTQLLTVSNTVALEIQEVLDVDPSRIHVVPNASSGLPKPDITVAGVPGAILAVGTMTKNKNYPRLAAAHKMLEPKIRKAHPLVIAGRGGFDSPAIEKAASGDPYIHLVGGVSDLVLSSLFRDASIFAQVSLYEGFAIPLLDAERFLLPVVCANIPVLREVSGSYASEFVDPFDASAIAHALFKLIESPPALSTPNTERYSWLLSAKALKKLLV